MKHRTSIKYLQSGWDSTRTSTVFCWMLRPTCWRWVMKCTRTWRAQEGGSWGRSWKETDDFYATAEAMISMQFSLRASNRLQSVCILFPHLACRNYINIFDLGILQKSEKTLQNCLHPSKTDTNSKVYPSNSAGIGCRIGARWRGAEKTRWGAGENLAKQLEWQQKTVISVNQRYVIDGCARFYWLRAFQMNGGWLMVVFLYCSYHDDE